MGAGEELDDSESDKMSVGTWKVRNTDAMLT